MKALSIRQPYAELILRGIKRIEYRSRPTKIIGQRFYIYAARQPGPPEAWAMLHPLSPRERARVRAVPPPPDPGVPTGVIVGTAIITRCTRGKGTYEWQLSDVKRLKRPRKPKRRPQPVWFRPF